MPSNAERKELQTAGRGSYIFELTDPVTGKTRKFVRSANNYADAYDKLSLINCSYIGKRKSLLRFNNWTGRIVSFVPEKITTYFVVVEKLDSNLNAKAVKGSTPTRSEISANRLYDGTHYGNGSLVFECGVTYIVSLYSINGVELTLIADKFYA